MVIMGVVPASGDGSPSSSPRSSPGSSERGASGGGWARGGSECYFVGCGGVGLFVGDGGHGGPGDMSWVGLGREGQRRGGDGDAERREWSFAGYEAV